MGSIATYPSLPQPQIENAEGMQIEADEVQLEIHWSLGTGCS